MLQIKNVNKIIGEFVIIDGQSIRSICDVVETKNALNEHYYSFMFSAEGDGKDWNKEMEVRISREPKEKGYELYVMGLHTVTVQYINPNSFKTIDALKRAMIVVMTSAWNWWKYEAHKL